ncbi:MAG TPA: competence/damage-inducible protein A [Cyclobacteriaceae bacterium]|nr:competence/damage-inducible protein A [Cyclobacteriaceae bacterium]
MNPIYIEIIAIGDELLYGQTLDTNSHWISSELDKVGFKVSRRTTIGDREDEIMRAFAEADQRASIVLITGGLGPTNDDLTKPCLAKFFDCELIMNEEALEEVTAFFRKRGRELTEVNRQQAALPACCTKITNAIGTAPGMWFDRNGKVFVSMPGVPHEMKMMMSNIIIPKLKQQFKTPFLIHQIIRTIGIGESFLAEKIKTWEGSLPSHIKLAYLPSTGEVKLRLTGMGSDEQKLRKEIDILIEKLLPLAGQYIYCIGDDPIEKVVGELLRKDGLKLSIAESCSGGYVSHLITSVPGSSEYFLGSIIPYDYELKMRQLGVRPETLEKFGAVSEPTITEMANNVRAKFNASIGVATSGIAGPGGATPDKPVGTIWIAYSDKHKTETRLLKLTHDRLVNIRYTATALLGLIWQNIRK